jgi:TonB family protein
MLVTLVAVAPAFAQTQETGRKIKHRVQPDYPELAKRNGIHGSVRLELQISADGHVKNVKVLGGSAVLVQASVDAVGKWLFEPESQASTMLVRFDFNP